jgi:hypothetical protein
MLLDGRPDLNPYAPTSIAHGAFRSTRIEFDTKGRDAALHCADQFDRNLNLGLRERVQKWTKSD